MDPTRLMTLPCTIRRNTPGARDEFGDPTDTWTETATVCWIAQATRGEETRLADIQAGEWHGYFPPATSIDGHDQVVVDGATYEVAGTPWKAWNPLRRRYTHIEATLTRTA